MWPRGFWLLLTGTSPVTTHQVAYQQNSCLNGVSVPSTMGQISQEMPPKPWLKVRQRGSGS